MSNNLKDDVKNAVPANKSNDKSTLPQFKPAKTVQRITLTLRENLLGISITVSHNNGNI